MSKESDKKARHPDDDAPEDDEAPAKTGGSSPEGDDEDDEDDADDEDDEDDVAKPPSRAEAGKKGGGSGTAKPTSKKPSSKRTGAERPTSKRAGGRSGGRPAPPRKGSSMLNLLVFVVIVGGLAAAFAVLGSRSGGGDAPPAPKWKVGETVDVQITLVHTDRSNLGCAMADEVAGRHCAFEAQSKRSTKPGDASTSAAVLQPFTTTEGVQMLAAGLWTQEILKKDLPKARFSVKCKLVVEGQAQSAWVQWKPGDPWYTGNGWFTGLLKDCGKPIPQR
jgi:hypothetical protein